MNEPTLTVIDSPVGLLGLGADGATLTHIVLRMRGPAHRGKLTGVLADAARQLAAYFAGRLHRFDVPLAPQGTPFQREVWDALRTIGYGETWSYRELAEHIGRPTAVRAVGAA